MKMRKLYPPKEYPFSDELCEFMDKNLEFYSSLKLAEKNFIFLKFISCSYRNEDEIIGLYYIDKLNRKCNRHPNSICRFKQDFIVNLGFGNKEFISYSRKNNNGKYVRPIAEFFEIYGEKGKFYYNGSEWHHHYQSLCQLPVSIQGNAKALCQKNNLSFKS